MPGFLGSLEAIGQGFGAGMDDVVAQNAQMARTALTMQAIQQQQQQNQALQGAYAGMPAWLNTPLQPPAMPGGLAPSPPPLQQPGAGMTPPPAPPPTPPQPPPTAGMPNLPGLSALPSSPLPGLSGLQPPAPTPPQPTGMAAPPTLTPPDALQPSQWLTPTGTGNLTAATNYFNNVILPIESGGNPNVGPSSAGAIGISQIKQGTFDQYMPGGDINNPQQNYQAGLRYFQDLYRQSGGNLTAAAVGYNAGKGGMDAYLRSGGDPGSVKLEPAYHNLITKAAGSTAIANAGLGLSGASQGLYQGAAQSMPQDDLLQGLQVAQQLSYQAQYQAQEGERLRMKPAWEAIDKEDISPAAKVMAMAQLTKLFAPEDKMAFDAATRENADLVRLAIAERRQDTTANQAFGTPIKRGDQWGYMTRSGGWLPTGGTPLGEQRQQEADAGKDWDYHALPDGTLVRIQKSTGKVDRLDVPAGTTKEPTGFQARSPAGIYAQAYHKEHPDASSDDIANAMYEFRFSQAAATAFGGSNMTTRNIASLNTVADHILRVQKYADDLHNGNIEAANAIAVSVAKQLGKPEPTTFEAGRDIMTGEVVRLLTSTGGTEGDRKSMQGVIDSKFGQDQFDGAFQVFKDMTGARFGGIQQEYESRGKTPEERARLGSEFTDRFLTPTAKQVFENIRPPRAGSQPSGGAPGQSRAAAPAQPDTPPPYQRNQKIWKHGKQYRVTGDDPNDPDVEPLQ